MDGFRVAGALVVGALTAAYLYFGGRFSIALVIIVGYGIYCNEASGGSQDSQEKLDLNKQQKKPCCSDKKIADGGKKTGGCCSDKKNGGGKVERKGGVVHLKVERKEDVVPLKRILVTMKILPLKLRKPQITLLLWILQKFLRSPLRKGRVPPRFFRKIARLTLE